MEGHSDRSGAQHYIVDGEDIAARIDQAPRPHPFIAQGQSRRMVRSDLDVEVDRRWQNTLHQFTGGVHSQLLPLLDHYPRAIHQTIETR